MTVHVNANGCLIPTALIMLVVQYPGLWLLDAVFGEGAHAYHPWLVVAALAYPVGYLAVTLWQINRSVDTARKRQAEGADNTRSE